MAYSDKEKKEATVPVKKTPVKAKSAAELMGSFYKNPSAMDKYEQTDPVAAPVLEGNGLQLDSDEEISGGTATKAPAKKTTRTPTPKEYKRMRVGKDSNLKIDTYHAKDSRYTAKYYKNNYNVLFQDAVPEVLKEKLRIVTYFLLMRTDSFSGSGDFIEYTTTAFSIRSTDFDQSKLTEAEKKHYGAATVFEFTRLNDRNSGGFSKDAVPYVLIKELGQESAPPTALEKQQQSDIFAKYFTKDASWTDAVETEQLYQAVARIPESILGKMPKIVFIREPIMIDPDTQKADPSVNGRFRMDGTIAIFDSAFAQGKDPLRHGDAVQGFSNGLDHTIVHELGHALDNRRTLPALNEFSEAIKKTDAADIEYQKVKKACEEGKHTPRADRACKKKLEEKRLAYTAASAENSRTMHQMALTRTDTDMANDPAASPFGKATAGEGFYSVTAYGGKNVEENYAELFALYILDEEKLKTMRPDTHAFFVANYPKQ